MSSRVTGSNVSIYASNVGESNFNSAISALQRRKEAALLFILTLGYAIAFAIASPFITAAANIIGPLSLALILLTSCYKMAERAPIIVWAPLFWFRLSSAIYFGIGPIIPHIVDDQILTQIYALYYYSDNTALKVNLITSAGLFVSLFASIYLIRWVCKNVKSINKFKLANFSILPFAITFLISGCILRYGLVLPYTFGLSSVTLAGSVSAASNAFYVGIYLIIVYAVNNRPFLLPFIILLVGFEVFISVISFAKTDLLLILIFSFMGFISNKVSKYRIVTGVVIIALAYSLFQPLVGFGRAQIAMRYGEIRGASLQERFDIVQTYLDGDDALTVTGQDGLARLSYMNVNAFVVDRYDAGQPGRTLNYAAAVFVPRAFWPNKPVITDLGSDLNFEVFGRRSSSLGAGLFSEAYWNFGWAGIPIMMIITSIILSIFTITSMRIMSLRDWFFLPFVFLGVYIGLRVDGFFVPDVLGMGWIAVVLGCALMLVRNLFRLRAPVLPGPAIVRRNGG